MVQSDIDPYIYYKIMENDDPGSNNAVTGFLLVITWFRDIVVLWVGGGI